jgi:putative hydrolase of the HAD superfamily
MIRGIGFDLDDTLYEHAQYVRGAYRDIAAAVSQVTGVGAEEFFQRIYLDWQQRTSRCTRIFSDALAAYGLYSPELERRLVEVYRAHRPSLTPHAGVPQGLRSLRDKGLRLGLLTDGQLEVQRRKVRVLGLEDAFDVLVYTGSLGRDFYKPHAAGFIELIKQLGVEATEAVYVGDNPFTDFESARDLGMCTVRVLSGEYRQREHELTSVSRNFERIADALEWLAASAEVERA